MTLRDRTFWSGILLAVIGLEIAISGAQLAWQMLRTDPLVRTADNVRDGVVTLPKSELLADAATLEARSGDRRTGDEAGALAILYYAAAQDSQNEGKTDEATREFIAARTMCLQTLAQAPTRADISLALAEIEYLLGHGPDAIEKPLLLSYLTAPRELWIIQRRIDLGLRLAAKASPELRARIVSDVDTLGEPYRDTNLYLILAQAAHNSGPYAVALVRHELAAINPEPLEAFNLDLEKLERFPASTSPHS
jgi:hypothetical protein